MPRPRWLSAGEAGAISQVVRWQQIWHLTRFGDISWSLLRPRAIRSLNRVPDLAVRMTSGWNTPCSLRRAALRFRNPG